MLVGIPIAFPISCILKLDIWTKECQAVKFGEKILSFECMPCIAKQEQKKRNFYHAILKRFDVNSERSLTQSAQQNHMLIDHTK